MDQMPAWGVHGEENDVTPLRASLIKAAHFLDEKVKRGLNGDAFMAALRDAMPKVVEAPEPYNGIDTPEKIGQRFAKAFRSAINSAAFPEPPVTPEMLKAGVVQLYEGGRDPRSGLFDADEAVADAYRAMHALAPVELVSDGKRQAVRERDSARHQVMVLTEDIQRVSDALTAERAALTLARQEIADLKAAMADDPKPDTTDIDRVVDALDRRVVPQGDRTRLRRSLDTADAPQTGRKGADEGLGRAVGRASAMGLRVP